jgi:hypothetical protein
MLTFNHRDNKGTPVHILTVNRGDCLNTVIYRNFEVILAEPLRYVLCQVQVNCVVVATVIPWEIWVIRHRVAKIDNLVFVFWFSWKTALDDTATLVLNEDLVIAIFIKLDNAVFCVRNMVIPPHSWARLTAISTWGTAWVKDEKVARLWVWGLNVP